jgi:hypothetical protein
MAHVAVSREQHAALKRLHDDLLIALARVQGLDAHPDAEGGGSWADWPEAAAENEQRAAEYAAWRERTAGTGKPVRFPDGSMGITLPPEWPPPPAPFVHPPIVVNGAWFRQKDARGVASYLGSILYKLGGAMERAD